VPRRWVVRLFLHLLLRLSESTTIVVVVAVVDGNDLRERPLKE